MQTCNCCRVLAYPPDGVCEPTAENHCPTKTHFHQRLDDAKVAHEETLEAERKLHRDKAAEGEGTIARMEHELKEASAEEER